MKKINYLLFSVIVMIFTIINVNANSISTYINGNGSIYPDSTIGVSIGVSNAPLLYGFNGKLEYDSSKIKLSSSSGLSGFSILVGDNITADSANGKSGSYSFISLNFTPTSSFKTGEKTTISFKNCETSDGENTLSCSSSSLVITMNAPKSKNNYLSNLVIDQGDISFDKNKDTYSIVVENDIDTVNISAKAEDNKSKVAGTGSKKLEIYENSFNIVVTSESGSKKTYTVIVTRKDENGKTTKPKEETKEKPILDNLVVENYDINFDKNKYDYSLELKEDESSLNINPTYDKDKYTYNIDMPNEFIVGENLITITLTDKDNNKTTYTIKVFKKEVIIDVPTDDICKCESTSSNYKTILFIENIILIIILIVIIIIKKNNRKHKEINNIKIENSVDNNFNKIIQ